jgi:hypothetical protein
MTSHRRLLLGLVLGAGLAAPARAADLDPYLPEDSEAVLNVNVRQIVGSALFKKNALEQIREAIKANEEVAAILKDLGFDPLADLDRITIASPGGNDQDRGLIIVKGRFDLDKFKARGADAAKSDPDILKIHKVADGQGGHFILYEVILPQQDNPLWVSLPEKNTLLASFGKDYVVDALKKVGKPAEVRLKDKELQALLKQVDDQQSVSLAVVGRAIPKDGLPGPVAEALAKVEAIGGGITLGDDIKLEVVVGARTVQEARELNRTINEGVNQGLAVLALLAINDENFKPLLEVAKGVRCNVRDKAVTIKLTIPAEVIEGLLGKIR